MDTKQRSQPACASAATPVEASRPILRRFLPGGEPPAPRQSAHQDPAEVRPFFWALAYGVGPVLILGGVWGIARGGWILFTEGGGSIDTAFVHVLVFGATISMGIRFLKAARTGRDPQAAFDVDDDDSPASAR